MKTILIDCDGVILDWEGAFHEYMSSMGYERSGTEGYVEEQYNKKRSEVIQYIHEVNHSDKIKNLNPIKDSIHYMKLLKRIGYNFICITSISRNESVKKNRMENFDRLLGKDFFDEVIFLNTAEKKDDVLKKYKDSNYWWIENNWKNAQTGARLGLRSILITQEKRRDVICLKDWTNIYLEILLS